MKLSKLAPLTLLAIVCAACSTPDDEHASKADALSSPPKATVWTAKFLDDAVLTAQEVHIEGPPGLLQHVVVVQDPENHETVTRTTPQGLLTEASLKPDGLGNAIRAQLDKLVIAADRSIVVLERPNAIAVIVDASGDAVFVRVEPRSEQRAPTLRIVGELAK